MTKKEIEYKDLGFLDIPYYAASDGHIYDREYHMANEVAYSGHDDRYKAVRLCGQRYAVHHLIGWAFPEIVGDYESGLEIDHLNTDPSDNRPENLMWCTHAENIHNPITLEKMSVSQKARWEDDELRQKQSKSQKKRWEDDEQRQKQSERLKAIWTDPEYRQKASDSQKKRWEDPEYRQKASDSQKKAWANPNTKLGTEQHRQKHSETQKKRMEDTELRQKQSKAMKKLWEDTELRQKQSKAMKASWQNPEIRQKRSEPLKKPIIQLTLDGEFIREWDSATDAYDELGIHRNHIGACCRGKRKTAGGFKWKYSKK